MQTSISSGCRNAIALGGREMGYTLICLRYPDPTEGKLDMPHCTAWKTHFQLEILI
jgi:hypothetical protein